MIPYTKTIIYLKEGDSIRNKYQDRYYVDVFTIKIGKLLSLLVRKRNMVTTRLLIEVVKEQVYCNTKENYMVKYTAKRTVGCLRTVVTQIHANFNLL